MNTFKSQSRYTLFQKVFLTFVVFALSEGCAKNGTFQTIESGNSISAHSSDSPLAVGYKPEALAWNSASHPERTTWSAALLQIVAGHFSDLDSAQDVTVFCPPYPSLSKDQKINLLADIFAATAYYESAWDPASNSVDVGTTSNSDTWSVGLLQLSVVDQQNYGLSFGFNFSDLQDPVKNLQLGVAIMARQIVKHGVLLIPVGGSGLYWATLHPGGRYDATARIAKMTKSLSFCH